MFRDCVQAARNIQKRDSSLPNSNNGFTNNVCYADVSVREIHQFYSLQQDAKLDASCDEATEIVSAAYQCSLILGRAIPKLLESLEKHPNLVLS